jgi:hypothetical protein
MDSYLEFIVGFSMSERIAATGDGGHPRGAQLEICMRTSEHLRHGIALNLKRDADINC